MLTAAIAVLGLGLLSARLPLGLAALLLLANVVSLVAMALDKARARTGGGRIPENLLHALCVAGGGGGAVGRAVFRHKTHHSSFALSTGMGAALPWAAVLLLSGH